MTTEKKAQETHNFSERQQSGRHVHSLCDFYSSLSDDKNNSLRPSPTNKKFHDEIFRYENVGFEGDSFLKSGFVMCDAKEPQEFSSQSKKVSYGSSLCVKGRRLEFWGRNFFSRKNKAILFSIFVHFILVLILLSIVIVVRVGTLGNATSLSFSSIPQLEYMDLEVDSDLLDSSFLTESTFNEIDEIEVMDNDSEHEFVSDSMTALSVDSSLAEDSFSKTGELGVGIPFFSKKGTTSSRTKKGKTSAFSERRQGDVTKESEDAVERGLEWLARHQLPDGGWAFNLNETDSNDRKGSCNGCSNSFATSGGTEYKTGLHPSRMAATAIAILPFLGSGYTHYEPSKYQKTVAAGIRYLKYNAIKSENGVDFRAGFDRDGSSYVQALAVLTCCEAYEMTQDPELESLSKEGLRFIESSQLNDGGWRYCLLGDLGFHANVHGDTSVLGWQMMALKSGVSAGFSVNASVAYRVGHYLDLVMSKDAKNYRYQPISKEKKSEMWGTTAVGVLVREYLGCEPGNPLLDAGVEQIADWIDDADLVWQKVKKGSRTSRGRNGSVLVYYRDDRLIHNLYFSYYSALALHHYGGSIWSERFAKIREFLIETQVNNGDLLNSVCENGSWLFYDKYMNDGGRLLNTALAILILETPYRYLPMYQ